MTERSAHDQGLFPPIPIRVEDEKELFCCFLDLLGFGEALDQDWPAAVRLYAEVLGEIYPAIAGQESRLTQRLFAPRPDSDSSQNPSVSVRFSAFSDSMMATSDNLMVLLRFVAVFTALSMTKGYPVRGCVSHGKHIEHVQGDFHLVVSTALRAAYRGESKRALYPRVILDPDQHAVFRKWAQEHRATMRDWVAQSNDDLWQVVPLLQDFGSTETLVSWLEAMLQRHQKTASLLQKYSWLADFVNAAQPVDFERPDIYQSTSLREALRAGIESHPEWSSRVASVWKYHPDGPEARFCFPSRTGPKILDGPDEFECSFNDNWSRLVQQGIRW